MNSKAVGGVLRGGSENLQGYALPATIKVGTAQRKTGAPVHMLLIGGLERGGGKAGVAFLSQRKWSSFTEDRYRRGKQVARHHVAAGKALVLDKNERGRRLLFLAGHNPT